MTGGFATDASDTVDGASARMESAGVEADGQAADERAADERAADERAADERAAGGRAVDGEAAEAGEVAATGRLSLPEMRSDLPVAAKLLVGALVVGALLGVVWAFVAPVRHVVELPGLGSASLGDENDHVFDALAVLVLLVTVFGVLLGAVAWRLRDRRGPVVLVATVLGALVGAWLTARTGAWLAPGTTPVPVLVDRAAASASATPGPPLPGTLVGEPAQPGPWWTVFIAGLAAALTYVLAAIWNGREDMDRSTP